MLSTRLAIALDRGLIALPADGRIAVFGARAGDDLSALPRGRTEVITRLYPDHRAFETAGWCARIAPEGRYALSVVVVPRARAEAEARLASAEAVTDGPLVIDGAKTDGVDTLLKALRGRADVGEVLSKAHGKLFVVTGGEVFDEQARTGTADGFRTAPGVFSADAVDPGSAALAEALPRGLSGRVVDLGAGWGYLADAVLRSDAVTHVDLVEADHAALDAARANVTDARAAFHWADARDWSPEAPADVVVCNPPFHTGRRADPSLGQAFIETAARILKPAGTLWLVANRHLPYERGIDAAFLEVQTMGAGSYKIVHAHRPRRTRTRRR